jgi:hypothetical protein
MLASHKGWVCGVDCGGGVALRVRAVSGKVVVAAVPPIRFGKDVFGNALIWAFDALGAIHKVVHGGLATVLQCMSLAGTTRLQVRCCWGQDTLSFSWPWGPWGPLGVPSRERGLVLIVTLPQWPYPACCVPHHAVWRATLSARLASRSQPCGRPATGSCGDSRGLQFTVLH